MKRLLEALTTGAFLSRKRADTVGGSTTQPSGALGVPTAYSVVETDINGTITVFNAGAERMLGYRAQDVIGQQTPELFHDSKEVADRAAELGMEPGFDVLVANARRGGADIREWTFVRRDGSRFPAELAVTGVRDQHNELTGFIGIAAEITRQKQLERDLREHAEETRTLVDLAPVGIFVARRDGGYTLVNERWVEIAGMSQAEAISDRWALGIHPDDRDQVVAEWQAAVHESRKFELDFRFQHPDLTVRWVTASAVPTYDEYGDVAQFLGTVLDITERHEYQQSREMMIVQSRAVLNATTECILLADNNGEVILSNNAMRQYWIDIGLADESTIWDRIFQMARLTETPDVFIADFARLAEAPDDEYISAYALPKFGRSFVGRTAPVRGPDGAMIGRIFSIHETTAERAGEQAREEFIAMVSHELRTPLTSIIGFLELLEEKDRDIDDDAKQFLGAIGRSASKLAAIVDDLLLVAKISADRLTISIAEVDLVEILNERTQDLRHLAEEADLDLFVQLPETLSISGDAERIGQVFDNLIMNAIKFTPSGGEIHVVLSKSDEQSAVVEISDTGLGIPEAEVTMVFDRFFRASTAVTNTVPGSGLGLSIVRSITEAHGGTVEIIKQTGPGTTVRVTFPLEFSEQTASSGD